MKIGAISFSYKGMNGFRRKYNTDGSYRVNLGDNAQSIATREMLIDLGISENDIIDVDRDTIGKYEGPPTIMIMNGVFYDRCFPLPEQITPVFIGFHAPTSVLETHFELLRPYMPIGCRDQETADTLIKLGIDAEVTGCITMAMRKRSVASSSPKKLLVVTGEVAGNLPPAVFPKIPKDLMKDITFIHHRHPVFEFPLSLKKQKEMERIENSIIDRYVAEASLVLTSLHHVTTPCMAQGIPVILCRDKWDIRFSYLESLTKIYYPDTVDEIDWAPAAFDNTNFRAKMMTRVAKGIADAKTSIS